MFVGDVDGFEVGMKDGVKLSAFTEMFGLEIQELTLRNCLSEKSCLDGCDVFKSSFQCFFQSR